MSTSSNLKKIGFASLIMMASVFASRIIGLLRETAIAGFGGASYQVDAYQVGFIIPEILNHVVASGFLSITFIPIFARYLSENREKEGYKIFSNIFNCVGLLLACFIVVSMIFAPELIHVLAPGMSRDKGFDLAVEMTRIIIPAQFFFFSGGLLMAVQFTKEKFFIPALAPLIYNLGIIIGGVTLYPVLGMKGFAWGVLGGAFAGNFALQVLGAKKCGLRFYPVFNPKDKDFIRYILITLPLMLGLTMTFSIEILMKFFGSFLAEGSIAAMNFALRIMFILVGFFGQAVGMASYPFMAKLAAQKDFTRLNALIDQTLKFIFIVLPFSVLLMVLRKEVVMVLFQRGAFDAHASDLTAGVLPFFLAGAFAFSAQTIVSRGYFAMQNTLFPAIFSTLCVLLSLPLIYGLMTLMGIKGVALGLSLSAALTCLILYEAWNRKACNTEKHQVYIFLAKLSFISAGLGILFQYIHTWVTGVIPPENAGKAFLVCLILGGLFVPALLIAGRGMKINEIHILFQRFTGRFWPWHHKKN